MPPAFFLGIAAFLLLPVSVVYWRILAFLGRSRAGARFALRFAILTGLASAVSAGVWLHLEYRERSPDDWTDLLLWQNLPSAVALFYGLVALGVGLIFPSTNPHRHRIILKCQQCGNKKHLHTRFCVRCGARLAPALSGEGR